MLPLVVRLHGEAIIDDGKILYRFPELQKRTRGTSSRMGGIADRVATALGLGIKSTSYAGEFVELQGAQRVLAFAHPKHSGVQARTHMLEITLTAVSMTRVPPRTHQSHFGAR